ncbi:MAG: AsnC family transcriptional regulator [Nitrososphaeria archaeon]
MEKISGPNVDTLDVKIIEALQENTRATCKSIAKKVGSSDRTIARRIKRMKQTGVIRGYKVEVDKELVKIGLLKIAPQMVSEDVIETSPVEWDSIASSIRDIFGVAGSIILFNIGEAIGRCYGKHLRGSDKSRDEQILNFSQIFQARGWGELTYNQINYEKGAGKVTISKMPFKHPTTENLVRGIFCGGLEEITSKKVLVKKVEGEEPAANVQRFIFEISG